MKIAYLILENSAKQAGVNHKISAQIESWQAQGHQVYQILPLLGVIRCPNGDEVRVSPVPVQKASFLGRKVAQIVFLTRICALMQKMLGIVQPEITYTRYLFPVWGVAGLKKTRVN